MIYYGAANTELGDTQDHYTLPSLELRSQVGRFRNAVTHGYVRIIQEALNEGVPIDGRDGRGRTALMLAAHYGQTLSVDVLLKNGADVMLRDEMGWDAIDWAECARTEYEYRRQDQRREIKQRLKELQDDDDVAVDELKWAEDELRDLRSANHFYLSIVNKLRENVREVRRIRARTRYIWTAA